MLKISPKHFEERKLQTLVENRTTMTSNHAELNIFETHQIAEQISLNFRSPVLASMIKGKKHMYLDDMPSLDFLPGESVILPQDETMCIDFPEATEVNPTQCLALALSMDKIKEAVNYLNDTAPKVDGTIWSILDYNFHFTNDPAIQQIIQRLMYVFSENHVSRDLFTDMLVKELTIRILQSDNRKKILSKVNHHSNSNRFSFLIKYIRNHISDKLSVDTLADLASMSASNFYKSFKNEMGMTPNEFVIQERLAKAEAVLRNEGESVKSAYLSTGFGSFSYFCRIFKKKYGISPGAFQQDLFSNSFKFQN